MWVNTTAQLKSYSRIWVLSSLSALYRKVSFWKKINKGQYEFSGLWVNLRGMCYEYTPWRSWAGCFQCHLKIFFKCSLYLLCQPCWTHYIHLVVSHYLSTHLNIIVCTEEEQLCCQAGCPISRHQLTLHWSRVDFWMIQLTLQWLWGILTHIALVSPNQIWSNHNLLQLINSFSSNHNQIH